MKTQTLYTVLEVARDVGVARTTLERWLRLGKVPEPNRDRNGWRRFSVKDLENVRKYANSSVPAGRLNIKQLQS